MSKIGVQNKQQYLPDLIASYISHLYDSHISIRFIDKNIIGVEIPNE